MAINKVVNNGQTLIDLTQDTVQSTSLLEGEKAHNRAGEQIVGVMLNLSNDTVTPQTLGKGATAHNAQGQQIIGTMESGVNTDDATVTADDILSGKTAYAKGLKVTGSMVNNNDWSGNITSLNSVYIPRGFHNGYGSVDISTTEKNKLIPANIKSGVTILGVTGNHQGSGGSTSGVQVKYGGTTNGNISTGLTNIDKLIIYSDKIRSVGVVNLVYEKEKSACHLTFCGEYSAYSKYCNTVNRQPFSVSGGNITWTETLTEYCLSSSTTYSWIAIGS